MSGYFFGLVHHSDAVLLYVGYLHAKSIIVFFGVGDFCKKKSRLVNTVRIFLTALDYIHVNRK